MKKLLAFSIALLLFFPLSLNATPPGNSSGWTLVFDDEFNGPSLNTAVWDTSYAWFQSGPGSPGRNLYNDDAEWYVDDPSYHIISNGVLYLKADKVTTEPGFPYTSAMIETYAAGLDWMYGYFEASMQIPTGQGFWPAFWLLPCPFTWPPEIDIMETYGTTTNMMSNHWTTDYPGIETVGVAGTEAGHATYSYAIPTMSSAFHTYGMEWTPTAITWYIDNVQVAQTTRNVPLAGYGFNGMFIIINLAVCGQAGSCPGPPNGSTVFPAYLAVDYVRVYANNSAPKGTAPVISGISASPVWPDSATINWTTDQASDSQVAYGLKANYGYLTPLNPSLTTTHSQTLSNLTAGTTYHFAVMSRTAAGTLATSSDNTFQTLPQTASYTIEASAASGGTITPSGTVSLIQGASQTFTIAPNSGYSIRNVVVDGSSVGAASSYTLTDVTSNHTITATFTQTRSGRSARRHMWW